ncbi:aryl-sulfate sulfotransferase [Polaribacter litorisediminis]|uniref:aryl-sulfate sulfotransferase n=1 Tax=Polaribacter litorisediminis TaxID=1908341 RepID=UPI001CC107BE|nr:aryl-sulfate sulfotransferase [Polaribacter litorisediminis]
MMFKKFTFLFLFLVQFVQSQNTVGTISMTDEVFDGYTLFSADTKTYLINNCGQVMNTWTSNFTPGNSVYLLPNGNLLRTGKEDGKSDIIFGGQGGIVELFNWDGEIIWSYSFNSNLERQHHDIYPMPNGHILILLAEVWSKEEAISQGRDSSKIAEERLYSEKILEVKPIGTDEIEVIWEWNIKDHIIQDFDDTKQNFGDVAKSPEKLDINFLNGGNGSANWLHINSIQYDEQRNQIVLSSRNLSEIWIIDHSTTTVEAASNSGGMYNKGGDLLYRWGNPQSYRQGTEVNRKLFGQHYPYYIEQGLRNAGDLILFNNGNGRDPDFSEVFILELPETNGVFSYTEDTAFGPENPIYEYSQFQEGEISNFYSPILSGAQVLPNGNILICEGSKGNFFEINSDDEIVWNYINPFNSIVKQATNQGEEPKGNNVFRAHKYAKDYAAFTDRILMPNDPIELNFNLNICNSLSTETIDFRDDLVIYPNPSANIFTLNKVVENIGIYNNLGKKVLELHQENQIDLALFTTGIYFAKINHKGSLVVKKLIKN